MAKQFSHPFGQSDTVRGLAAESAGLTDRVGIGDSGIEGALTMLNRRYPASLSVAFRRPNDRHPSPQVAFFPLSGLR